MKNAYQDGRVLDVKLTAAVESGGIVSRGKLFGPAVSKGAVGEVVAVHVEGVFRLPKATGAALTTGASAIWKTSNSTVIGSGPATGDVVGFGYVVEDAASAATSVLVRLTPGTATIQA